MLPMLALLLMLMLLGVVVTPHLPHTGADTACLIHLRLPSTRNREHNYRSADR